MKKIISSIKANPMMVVFVLILVFFTPTALFSPGESDNKAIVTAIGLDKQGEEYEVSLLTFIPTPNQTFLETNSVISGKGDTVAKAIANAQLTLGKEIGFSHAKTTVLTEAVLQQDISKDIDYLSRVSALTENTVVICTNDSAKKFLLAAQSLEKNIGLKLDELISYNIKNIYVTDTTLEAFYKGYFSPIHSSIMGYLALEESSSTDTGSGGGSSAGSGPGAGGSGGGSSASGSQGGSSGGSGSGGGTSGSGGQASEGMNSNILNFGDVVLLKDGKMAAKLTGEQLNGINILNKKARDQIITLEHVTGEEFEDATLTFIIKNKKIVTKTKFSGGLPIYSANVVIGLDLIEAKEANGAVVENYELDEIPDFVRALIEKKLKTDFASTLNILREKQTDVLVLYEKFQHENRKNFNRFLDSLDDKEDFLKYVTFELDIRAQLN